MKKMWNSALMYFVNGVVLLLPVALTVGLVRFLVLALNNVILEPLLGLFAPVAAGTRVYIAKTLIFLFVIAVVTAIGWGAKIIVINRLFSLGERLLLKVPVMGRIYNAAKQIFSAFFGQGKTIFKQVVMIEYPRKGIYSVGFTTGVSRGEIRKTMGDTSVNVFIPTTPNPTSGMFLVVPRSEVHFLRMSVEDGMKLVVSGGSVTPPMEDGGE
jgi:uncharacterized membrane protein